VTSLRMVQQQHRRWWRRAAR